MIDEIPEGSASHAQEIPFPAQAPAATIKPVANHLLLDYQKPSMAGALHLPVKVRQLETIVAKVFAVGPDVKHIKPGQSILILAKALIGGEDGLMVEGQRCYLTQEQVVIAVVGD